MSDQWDEKAKEIRRSFIPFNVACPGLEEAIAIALRAAAIVSEHGRAHCHLCAACIYGKPDGRCQCETCRERKEIESRIEKLEKALSVAREQVSRAREGGWR